MEAIVSSEIWMRFGVQLGVFHSAITVFRAFTSCLVLSCFLLRCIVLSYLAVLKCFVMLFCRVLSCGSEIPPAIIFTFPHASLN